MCYFVGTLFNFHELLSAEKAKWAISFHKQSCKSILASNNQSLINDVALEYLNFSTLLAVLYVLTIL